MKTCAICGKEIDILYPDLWRYKRGDPVHVKVWLCSWKCLRTYDDPEKRKEAEEMARMKKDGTPAAKPGRKPKEERPRVILQYDESIAEEYRKEQEAMAAAVEQPEPEREWIPAAEVYGEPEKPAEEKWEVTAIRSADWVRMPEVIPQILKMLGVG